MADKNLTTDITAAGNTDGTELLYIVQGGNTRKITFSNLVTLASASAASALSGTETVVVVQSGNGKKATTQDFKIFVGKEFIIACSDEDTALSAGTGVRTFRMPKAMTLTAVRASLNSACTTGTFTVDINEGGTTILSTKLTIDATETTSTTAATAVVISDSALADDALITIDIDDAGDGTATGLKVAFIGY